MAKTKAVYRCQECGRVELKWLGQCPTCQTWDSFAQELEEPRAKPGLPAPSFSKPVALTEVSGMDGDRRTTGSAELDRVLGGGVRGGMVVLVGGDPGIGKSTLMLQCLGHLASVDPPVLYLSGEESARQLKLRAGRLKIGGKGAEGILLHTETTLERILPWVDQIRPKAVVVDSIQTFQTERVNSAPGSLVQVRESTARFSRLAKERNIPLFLVGHVTKSGALAGPKMVEHMVDTVLYFEGRESQGYRILRAVKNRFGSTNEIGVFEMTGLGLREVENPSALFLSERPLDQPGSVVVPCLEGTRPILVEIQALVTPTPFSQPKRTSLGVDSGRVSLLAAVLEKKLGLSLSGQDIYLNVAGGVRVVEPGADLGVALALASSLLDRVVDSKTVLLGEVGLAGEVRNVPRPELRLAEAAKLGFERAIVPQRAARGGAKAAKGLELMGVEYLKEAIRKGLGKG